jgi:crotonobetainyl-CoA:carnitine CoA-transferase CaiB-like acyl-CoA transferase
MKRLVILVVLLLLIALALIMAARGGRPREVAVRLTSEARTLFASWMVNHPKAREREQRRSGVRDILESPGEFFEIELREPEHADVADMVKAADGMIDVAAMGRWIIENTDEIYNRGRVTSDAPREV